MELDPFLLLSNINAAIALAISDNTYPTNANIAEWGKNRIALQKASSGVGDVLSWLDRFSKENPDAYKKLLAQSKTSV
jgi:hypothetical protein